MMGIIQIKKIIKKSQWYLFYKYIIRIKKILKYKYFDFNQNIDLIIKSKKKCLFHKYSIIYRKIDSYDISIGSRIYVALHQIEYSKLCKRKPIIIHDINSNKSNDLSEIKNQLDYVFARRENDIKEISSKNDIRLITSIMPPAGYWYDFWKVNKRILKQYTKIFNRYFKLNITMQEKLDSYIQENFKNYKVLGLLLRGTDYNATTAKGHPVPPNVNQVIKIVRDKMTELNFNKIFIATEDKNILSKIIETFGQNVIYIDQPRFTKVDGKQISQLIAEAEIDNVELLRNYMLSLYLLAKCNGIICSNTSGSMLLPLMNPNWEFSYRFDLGCF